MEDEKFMKIAFQEALKAFEKNEVPIGAIVVKDGRIVGKGHNMTESLKDSTAHAEIIAITAASQTLGSKYLTDCCLYVTLEPCIMCAGAIGLSHISRIVYGAADIKNGFSQIISPQKSPFHPRAVVVPHILERDCGDIIKEFFNFKRKKNREL